MTEDLSRISNRDEVARYLKSAVWLHASNAAVKRWWVCGSNPMLRLFCLLALCLPLIRACIASPHLLTLVVSRWFAVAIISAGVTVTCRSILKKHLQHGLSVRITSSGIELKNRFQAKSLLYSSIRRVVPVNKGEFLIDTTSGAYYFPSDQDWSDMVAETLRNNSSMQKESYSLIMHFDPLLKLELAACGIALVGVFLQFLIEILLGVTAFNASAILTMLMLVLFLSIGYLFVSRSPETFLIGDSVTVVDKDGEHRMNLSDIQKVRSYCGVVWFFTRGGNWNVPTGFVVDQSLPRMPYVAQNAKQLHASSEAAKRLMKTFEPKRLH